MTDPVARLGWDQALAWRMRRQHLGARVPAVEALAVVARLGGLHAQLMSSAELSLWARVEALDAEASRPPVDGPHAREDLGDARDPAPVARRRAAAVDRGARDPHRAPLPQPRPPEGLRRRSRAGAAADRRRRGGARGARADPRGAGGGGGPLDRRPRADWEADERLLPAGTRERVYRAQGWISPVLLVDGRMAGVWRHERVGDRLRIQVEPFDRLPSPGRRGIDDEAERLAAFLGGRADLTVERA